MVCGNWGDFNAFSTRWLHVPVVIGELNCISIIMPYAYSIDGAQIRNCPYAEVFPKHVVRVI